MMMMMIVMMMIIMIVVFVIMIKIVMVMMMFISGPGTSADHEAGGPECWSGGQGKGGIFAKKLKNWSIC